VSHPASNESVEVGEGAVMARFGMLGKLVAHPGRREDLVELLMDAAKQ
jgi:hypothetical protein